MRVLHVEDDRDMRELMSMTVNVYYPEMEIDSVKDGKKAFELLSEENCYSCIISDFSMPKMSGLDLVEQLERAEFDVPVVMFTGDSDVEQKVDSELVKDVCLKHNTDPQEVIETVVDDVLSGPVREPVYQEEEED